MARPPVKGTSVASVFEDAALAIPGAFAFEATDRGLFYVCPCGCGSEGFLPFRWAEPNQQRPSWEWDGNRDAPTLSPSVRRVSGCKWHGFLRAGIWEFCEDSGRG